jgi:hypothetical protein
MPRKTGKRRTQKKNFPKIPALDKRNPCWIGYKKIGMKTKKGRIVPNCVSIF